ncbi:Phosphatidylinositol N-acetylglucosaminyltransferase subunit gpi15 [Pseudocercospora fuligena]|uniref:Phosphatidylinositol N-acetylglucosaminyltransferase subunit gpi15 n=1 Tax=Pseudocercospora fuligena TaxID=685502 RepID=A0A8H6RBT9_9PEZI|nr:Phosphatidylinositol N-acetylglucosaminyltransferase subunit gpi15 [Pseudocercospora fuligena]
MLTTRRPTPTTVLYTVSTSSGSKTLTAKAFRTISILLRILAAVFVTTILLREYQLAFPDHDVSSYLVHQHTWSSFPLLLDSFRIMRPYRLLLCMAMIWMISRKGYTEESLLVIRGLGVQTTTSSNSYLWGGGGNTRFIPSSSIQDIWIHEAFKGFEVKFYLCIVIEGEEGVVVVFPTILPRREVLEQVWRGARACLYEPKA